MAIADQETAPLLSDRSQCSDNWSNGFPVADDGVAGFDPEGDEENPREWAVRYKWFIVFLLVVEAFTVTFSCISVVPIARRISRDLGGAPDDTSSEVLLVTIWELGEAAGPLLIGSLSELFGRSPAINAANAALAAALVLGALSTTLPFFTFTRVLAGAAVATNVLGPAVIGDMFVPEERGAAMSLILVAPLLGSSFGPAFAGAVVEAEGWQFVVWVCAALATVGCGVFLVLFRETYAPVILRRRAQRWLDKCGDGAGAGVGDEGRRGGGEAKLKALLVSLSRPVVLICSSPVLMGVAVYVGGMFSHFNVIAVTMPRIIEDVYELSPAAAGASFFVNAIGSLFGIIVCRSTLDSIYVKLRDRNGGVGLPEYRLPISILGGISIVPAVNLYGWCTEYKLPLAVFLGSVVWVRLSLIMAFVPFTAYVVDACGAYSASALAGVIVARCLAGAFVPLVTDAAVQMLGRGWGFSAYSAFSLVLVAVPVLLFRSGSRWRLASEYTRNPTAVQ